jgi:carbamoyl-phosphate synthase large subunit
MDKNKTFNILFTSAGRRVSLIRYFREALTNLGLTGHIVATDMNKAAAALHVSDSYEEVPPVVDSGYISRLMDICLKYDIRLVIPLIDTELLLLAIHKREFQKMGATFLVSSIRANEICSDKRKTYAFFKKIGIETPEIFNYADMLKAGPSAYPVLLKPKNGSASIGVTKIRDKRELAFFKARIRNSIIQEFVTGEEYTLDILADLHGKVRSVVPRLRIETRAGEVSKGMTVKNQAIIALGKKVVESLPGAFGCITVQCFLTSNGNVKFIEINPRFGGGFPLAYKAGANFPRWIIEMLLGKNSDISIDGWQDGLVMLRYDEGIFITREMIL